MWLCELPSGCVLLALLTAALFTVVMARSGCVAERKTVCGGWPPVVAARLVCAQVCA